jgi:hypothetical protein
MMALGADLMQSASPPQPKKIARTEGVSFLRFQNWVRGWHRESYAFSTGAPMGLRFLLRFEPPRRCFTVLHIVWGKGKAAGSPAELGGFADALGAAMALEPGARDLKIFCASGTPGGQKLVAARNSIVEPNGLRHQKANPR